MNEQMNTYFQAMEGKAGNSFTRGGHYAYRTWDNSNYRRSSELECEDCPDVKDMEDFVKTLREAGAETLVITETSTALMWSIHALAELGCTMEGLCVITRKGNPRWEEEVKQVQGIRFRLN